MMLDGLNTFSFGDNTLSKQYNVGCYPVSIQAHEETLYDLADTYWVGCANNVPADMQYAFPCPTLDFLFWIGPSHDDDHKQHGGYTLYTGWVALDDVYIYSHQNQNRPGQGRSERAQHDGQNVSMQTATHSSLMCETQRWLMAIWDADDTTLLNV